LRIKFRNNALNLVLSDYRLEDRVKQWDLILSKLR